MNKATITKTHCFHCAEKVAEPEQWHIRFDEQQHAVCCAGCEAIANTILAAGLDDYYRFRSKPATFGQVPEDVAGKLDALIGWDAPEISERYLSPVQSHETDSLRALTLSVEGLRCGACVWLLERSLYTLPGVEQVRVNFSIERVHIIFNPEQTALSELIRRGVEIGYSLQPYDVASRELSDARSVRQERQRLFVAALGSMQVMMYALPVYLAPDAGIERQYVDLLRWASLVLTIPVMLYSAKPFFRAAYRDILARAPGMDVPVALGLLVAFIASVLNTFRGTGEVWFDSVSMFVFLLLGARLLESTARRRARQALDTLGSGLPDTAMRIVSNADDAEQVEQVPVSRLTAGDRVRVAAGERIPADGIFLGEMGSVDFSMLNGESVPVVVRRGKTLPGGAIVAESPMTLNITKPANESALSLLAQLVERSAAERPSAALLADRVAKQFVAALLVLVGLVFIIWWQIEPQRAAEIAIATLIVSCPCALSMAVPTALAATTARLLQWRLLITKPHALENAATITDIVFDKTGTLTQGKPQVRELIISDSITRQQALYITSTLESGSAHPFARAIRALADKELADKKPAAPVFLNITHTTGQGVVAGDNQYQWYLGSPEFCGLQKQTIDQSRLYNLKNEPNVCSEVWLSRRLKNADGSPEYMAHFLLSDPIRSDAAAVLSQLSSQGYRLHLLSGDHQSVVNDVASRLNITDARAHQSPDAKRKAVVDLQSGGANVLMVGDGLNDAPVMAVSNVSLAIGEASDLTRNTSDAVALATRDSATRGGLTAVKHLLHAAIATRQVIRQNLFWAASYNFVMIPLTATGQIPPWGAAIGMAASSLFVCANALRLHSPHHLAVYTLSNKLLPSLYQSHNLAEIRR